MTENIYVTQPLLPSLTHVQKQLEEILQTKDESIYSWEKGRSQTPIETLRKICIELNVSADYLIGVKTDA